MPDKKRKRDAKDHGEGNMSESDSQTIDLRPTPDLYVLPPIPGADLIREKCQTIVEHVKHVESQQGIGSKKTPSPLSDLFASSGEQEIKAALKLALPDVNEEELNFLTRYIKPLRSLLREYFLVASKRGGMRIKDAEGKFTNITRFDLFSLPPGVDLSSFILRSLAITDFTKEDLDRLSSCFQKAKVYLKTYLHLRLPTQIEKIPGFRNKGEILAFLKQTESNQSKQVGLTPYFCALAKVTFTFWEYEQGEYHNLIGQTQYLYEGLKNCFPQEADSEAELAEKEAFRATVGIDDPLQINRFHSLKKFGEDVPQHQAGKEWMNIMINESNIVNVYANYRGKTPDRIITKMLSKPEFDVKQAITDGLGIRFEVNTRMEGVELICFLKKYLFSSGLNVELRDHQFKRRLSEDDKLTMEEMIESAGLQWNEEPNTASADEFESVNIRGDIDLPKDPNDPLSITAKIPVEFQVVLKGNKNEEGYNGHEIYEAQQKLQAVSRLFGLFSEDYLGIICAEASEATGGKLKKEGIKKYVLDNGYITPVKVKHERQQRTKYCWTSHMRRWQQVGLLPKTITAQGESKQATS